VVIGEEIKEGKPVSGKRDCSDIRRGTSKGVKNPHLERHLLAGKDTIHDILWFASAKRRRSLILLHS